MSADNVVLLFTLLWAVTAVCQADDDFSVSCDDVTGYVGKEVNLTCSISQQLTICCIVLYSYYDYEGSVICKEELPYRFCEQRNSFTCSYTSPTAMTQQFRFILQTTCGVRATQFTVDLAEPLKDGTDTEAPVKKGLGTEVIIITGVSCFITFITFIIIMVITCVKRLKNTNASGLQKRYERGASEEQTVMTTNV